MSLTSTNFNKYEITDKMAQTARSWGDSYLYKTSYSTNSEKNVPVFF